MERGRNIGKREWREFLNGLRSYQTWEMVMNQPDVPAKIFVLKRGIPWPKGLSPGNYIYVLMPDSEFRFPYYWEGDIHHPQLAKRRPVIMAGVFGWNSESITFIDNKSGCYRPEPFFLDVVPYVLKFYGVPLHPNLKIQSFFH